MPHRLPRPLRPSGIAWLLCLALLLPLAQLSALWHGVSHGLAGADAPGVHKPGTLPGHCDLCLAGAALGSAAAPDAPSPWPGLAARHARPLAVQASVWQAGSPRAYRSRAPPPAVL